MCSILSSWTSNIYRSLFAVIVDDVCTLGFLDCPENHFCVPDSTSPEGGVCLRSCELNNGGCGGDQLCLMVPYCEDCEMSDVKAGVCRDFPGLGEYVIVSTE